MVDLARDDLRDPESFGDDIQALCVVRGDESALMADYFAECLRLQDEGRAGGFLALKEGRAVAFAMLNRQPRYALFRRLGMPEIQDVYTLEAARGQGAASALLEHCEEAVRAFGGAQIGISVALHGAAGAAQRLYIKRGYLPDGFGVSYDREAVSLGEVRPVDDDLCLMMVKDL